MTKAFNTFRRWILPPRSRQRGAVMLEAAILVPFLLFTGLCCWDATKLLNAHALLLQNADDIAQWAAADPDLEIGEFQTSFWMTITVPPPLPSPVDPDLCLSALGYRCYKCSAAFPACGASSCGGAAAVRQSLCEAITASESGAIPEIRDGSIVARINFNTPLANPDRVEVVITAKFDGLFLFKDEPIMVRKMLPYLGPRQP
jgi:hypothetical protein